MSFLVVYQHQQVLLVVRQLNMVQESEGREQVLTHICLKF